MMRPRGASWLLPLFLLAPDASAQLRALRVVRAEGPTGALREGPVQARVGDEVALVAAVRGPRGALRRPPGARTRWLRVIPRMAHEEGPPPNPGNPTFSNAVLFGPRHGRWIGYDRLEYETRPLRPDEGTVDADGTLRVRAAALTTPRGGAGTVWFSAELTLPDGAVLRAPDGASVDRLGLSREVARVSFRADDTFLGWLSTYFGVANVFGSNGTRADHQTDRYTGADCADVLVGALRAGGARGVPYLSVAQIGEAATRVTRPLTLDRAGVVRGATLRWGVDVRPGDLVTLGYRDDPENSLPRAWDHIGALVEDRNRDGLLDGGDTLRHMSARGLDDTPLLHGGPMQIAVWRWRARR